MNTPTYQKQWQKITRAYVNERLNPYLDCACFIGNLLGTPEWHKVRGGEIIRGEAHLFPKAPGYAGTIDQGECAIYVCSFGLYDKYDVLALERNFLKILWDFGKKSNCEIKMIEPVGEDGPKWNVEFLPGYEDALFNAMTSTLEMLRQIHISKGEQVDEIILSKRVLSTTT